MAEPSAEWSRSVVVGEVDNSRPPALAALPRGGGAVVAWGSDAALGWAWMDGAGTVRGRWSVEADGPIHSLALESATGIGNEAVRAYWLNDIAGGAFYTALLTLSDGVVVRKLAGQVSAFGLVREMATGTANGGGLVFSDGAYLYFSPGVGAGDGGAGSGRAAVADGGEPLPRERGVRLPNIDSLDAVRFPAGGVLVAVGSQPGYFTYEYQLLLREPSGEWRGPWQVAKVTSGATVRPGRVRLAVGGPGAEVLVLFDVSGASRNGYTNKTWLYRGWLDGGGRASEFTMAKETVPESARAGKALVGEVSELSPGPVAPDGSVLALATATLIRSLSDRSREVIEVRLRQGGGGGAGVAEAVSARRGVALSPAVSAGGGACYAAWLSTGGFGRYQVVAAGTGQQIRAGLGKSGAREWRESALNLLMRYGMSYVALFFATGWLIPSFIVILLGYVVALTWAERFPTRLWFLGMLAYLAAKLYVLQEYFYAPAYRWLMPEELGGATGMAAAGVAIFAVAVGGAWFAWRRGELRSALNGWWRVAAVDAVLTALIWTPYLAR